MEYITKSLEETYKLAEELVKYFAEKRNQDGATVVGLFGDLGSGKTSFTQGVAQALGIKDNVTSPTFVLEKIYKIEGHKFFERLIHIDAYRLNGGHEMSALGWNEILKDAKNLILIEWPERVGDVLPKDIIKMQFTTGVGENERKISILC